MLEFGEALEAAGIAYRTRRQEGVLIFEWDTAKDSNARKLLCRIHPLPPPSDRSVQFVSVENADLFQSGLRAMNVEFETQEFLESLYIVWNLADRMAVERLYLDLFGQKMMYGSGSEIAVEQMGCSREIQSDA